MRPTGIILLIGIVKKNGIIMTTMCAILAGLPLALGHGTGSEQRRPLGFALVGGLVVSQAPTLYTTPVVYLYLDRASRWYAARRAARGSPKSGGSAVAQSD